MARRRLRLAAADLRVAAARRRLRHQRLHEGAAGVRRPRRLRRARRRGAQARHAHHRRPGHEPLLRRAPVVPGLAQRPRGPVRRLLRVVRHRRAVLRGAHHLRRHRDVQLDVGPGPQAVLLAPLLQPPAGPQLREPGRAGSDDRRAEVLAGPGHRRLPPRRRAVPVRGARPQRREPPEDARVPQARAQGGGRALPRPRDAVRGQPVARGRRRVLRRGGRRVPDGVPLPAHAAPVHGGAPRVALPDLGDPRQHAGDPGRAASGASSCATTTS